MRFSFLLVLILQSINIFAQTQQTTVKGNIRDAGTKETVIGANILFAEGKGTTTDIDGNYEMKLDDGEYTLMVTYVGYAPQKRKIKATGGTLTLNFEIESVTLNEVEIVADVARTRETPIAFSTITPKQIQEELSSRDLPMLLNSTPGVYATEQGGGSGDARITIRGFDQRNIAVLVDGVPVNDMENGQVYWSNWSGIGDITRSVQVQRGLGASKLAIASVGGTMNTITKGIESKRNVYVKQEVGNNNMLKTSAGYTSGLLKGDWGFTLAGSWSKSDGWVDQNWSKQYSYFAKVQKRFGKHMITIGANGAPQSHAQRNTKLPVAVYDTNFAKSIGARTDTVYNSEYTSYKTSTGKIISQGPRGLTYNSGWGYVEAYETKDGVRRHDSKIVNEQVNFYHKPLFNLTHHWTPSNIFSLTNVAYLSIGKGGGTGFSGGAAKRDTVSGQYDIKSDYLSNQTFIDKNYSLTETKSQRILRSSNNDHLWYGLLSTANWNINEYLTYTGGIDLRSYTGYHYRTVYDLLGGDYYINRSNNQQPKPLVVGDANYQQEMKRKGDKIDYHNVGYVRWGGVSNQLELKYKKWTSFITVTVSQSAYKRKDYFAKKDVILSDTTFKQAVGWGDTLIYDGNSFAFYDNSSTVSYVGDSVYVKRYKTRSAVGSAYNNGTIGFLNPNRYDINSEEAKTSESAWRQFTGYTIKTGANYNINDHHNVYLNAGLLSMPPRYNNVFDNNNNEFLDIKNQLVKSVEAGYGVKYRRFASNVNVYYTHWLNKPSETPPTISTPDGNRTVNINGMLAIHKGAELDFTYKIFQNLDFDGLVSLGDWRYNNSQTAYLYDENSVLVDSVVFSAKGVHVGNAAQTQYGASLRYEPIKNLYFKTRFTYFDKMFASFDPFTLTAPDPSKPIDATNPDNRDKESWRTPAYYTLDFYAGYDFKYHDLRFSLTGGLINSLNAIYISDAQNGINFDASTAAVFLGQGRRFNLSLKMSF